MLSDAFPGVVRACRGSTRPRRRADWGNLVGTVSLQEKVGAQTRLGSSVGAARRFIEARVRMSSSEEVLRNTRVGEPAAMQVLGTTAAERRHREVSGVERHEELAHVAVRGSANTVERRFEARPGLHGPTR